MKGLWNHGLRAAMVLLGTAALAAAQSRSMPNPGTVNYVEGQVALNGQDLSAKSAGNALIEPDQVLDTGQGKAEILLTPGVFLRVGDNSQLRMVSPSLSDTQVELLKGSAMLEVAELFNENNLSVVDNGATATIEKKGLYAFHADRPSVSVLDGKAVVSQGDDHVTLKKGRQTFLNPGQPLKSQKFDKDAIEADSLYRWSKLRSDYASQASAQAAQTIVVGGGGWYGPGWYWDPYWSFYSFIPGSGILYSPFGWGFYSPGWAWRAPIVYYRYPARRVAPPSNAGHVLNPGGSRRFHMSPRAPRVQSPRVPEMRAPAVRPPAPVSPGFRPGPVRR